MELQKEIALSLDADEPLLPWLDELLADLPTLGTEPAEVLEVLQPLRLPTQKTTVLELGCGKGVLSVALAKQCGFHMHSVDAYAPFIKRAKKLAENEGVTGLCTFYCADVRDFLHPQQLYDIVIWAGLCNILGNVQELVRHLRAAIRPGGYMVLDQSYCTTAGMEEQGCADLAVSHQRLQAFGDRLLQERIPARPDTKTTNDANTDAIRRRAEQLKIKHPELAALFDGYVAAQEAACLVQETSLSPVLWLVQRGG